MQTLTNIAKKTKVGKKLIGLRSQLTTIVATICSLRGNPIFGAHAFRQQNAFAKLPLAHRNFRRVVCSPAMRMTVWSPRTKRHGRILDNCRRLSFAFTDRDSITPSLLGSQTWGNRMTNSHDLLNRVLAVSDQ